MGAQYRGRHRQGMSSFRHVWNAGVSGIGHGIRTALKRKFMGAGSAAKTQKRSGRDTGSTSKYADTATLYRRRAAPRRLRNRVRAFANRVRSVIDGEVGLQVAVIPYTTYADTATLYRRRAAPRRLRNRVRAFANRVRSVIDGEVGLQVAVIPYTTNSGSGCQTPVEITALTNEQATSLLPGLYSANGNHPSYAINGNFDDLYAIFNAYKPSGVLVDNTILEFTAAVWNCCLANVTGNGTRAVVDIYECVARRDWKPNDDPVSIFRNTFPDNSQFAQAGAQAFPMSSTQLGVTPFDNPLFCEQWKILKVRRIKLEDGATATLQFRDPKHRKIEYQTKVQNKTAVRGVTRCWIPIIYGQPVDNAGAPLRAESVKVVFDVQRNYHFRQLSTSTPSAGLLLQV
ncbi:Cap [Molossus molossus associated circovirus 2]|nr:Cap [Molossus molossus associated circovirus 2]